MHCYCANYYGAVNCHNKVSQFGERCKLCTVMNEGASATYEQFNAQQAYYDAHSSSHSSHSSRDDSSQIESRGRTRERKNKESRRQKS
ncbi:uncharacterized protein BCR38DRAFT_427756 [Pseudomassariella vexata]|uniref:Uncharacterized protein n=1 Tax=Pseudomassariella vexata TaxID=1141098 RepID=A0A1Y2E7W0_9PEZI|nr:uncharacterized protein BCR38DRAFT_427756 [Pseudomassariella vexata]ORY67630.1 hypothetical protein BCR38DRAFT_427756 [Pseudomassariella vexata]